MVEIPFLPVSAGKEEKTMNETVGQRIRECRKVMGMTQEELEVVSCIPKSTLSAYECDKVDIRIGTIKELATILHTTAGYLIDGDMPDMDEDIMQVVKMLQYMPEGLRKAAVEQVKVLSKMKM